MCVTEGTISTYWRTVLKHLWVHYSWISKNVIVKYRMTWARLDGRILRFFHTAARRGRCVTRLWCGSLNRVWISMPSWIMIQIIRISFCRDISNSIPLRRCIRSWELRDHRIHVCLSWVCVRRMALYLREEKRTAKRKRSRWRVKRRWKC